MPKSVVWEDDSIKRTPIILGFDNQNPQFTPISYKQPTSNSSSWETNYSVGQPKSNIQANQHFQNGDTVEIKNKNHKYGHTAIYYNGKWYSDFGQQTMDPYSDKQNSTYRIFRNPNREEAEKAAQIIASRATNKTRGICAKAVREGFNIASGGKYQGEGYNGNNIGDYLLKKNWTQIAKNGMKIMQDGGPVFAVFQREKSYYDNPYQNIPTFGTFETMQPIQYKEDKSKSNDWGANYNVLTNTPTMSNSQNEVISKLIKGGYATDPKYAGKILSVINYANTKAGGNNKKFYDTMKSAYIKNGKDENTATVLAAQDALESAWGTKVSGTHNYGGIKGKGTEVATHEVINGKSVGTKASFRNFSSPDEYVKHKIDLLDRKYGIT